MGAVFLGTVEFFLAEGNFSGGPIGSCGGLCAVSRPVKAINKMAIWRARMHSDCSAISWVHFELVILSEAKDLLSGALTRKQVLRFAQDDKLLQ
jgi:hypothetical protein